MGQRIQGAALHSTFSDEQQQNSVWSEHANSSDMIMFSGNKKADLRHIEIALQATYTERTSVPTFLYQVVDSEGYLNNVIYYLKKYIYIHTPVIYSLYLGSYWNS